MGALDLVENSAGTRLRLRVKAGARRNAITGLHAGALKLSVTSAPELGRANRAVLALVAKTLDLPPSALVLLSGESSPDKVILIPLPAAIVRSRIETEFVD